MSEKLQKLNARIENLRSQLFFIVKDKDAVDADEGYRLLRELNNLQSERDNLALRDLEVAAALETLNRHGVVYKVWSREDVLARLAEIKDHDITKEWQEAIADHVTEGDDWKTMSEVTAEDEAKLWDIIRGTAGDHPEWFPAAVRDRL